MCGWVGGWLVGWLVGWRKQCKVKGFYDGRNPAANCMHTPGRSIRERARTKPGRGQDRDESKTYYLGVS
ncbi:hypothetical protein M0802_003912 [Mischocyttarus mexicanus]|nr:hypothetical protein M0802_003912 [Mischocyttarus mexicanus]